MRGTSAKKNIIEGSTKSQYPQGGGIEKMFVRLTAKAVGIGRNTRFVGAHQPEEEDPNLVGRKSTHGLPRVLPWLVSPSLKQRVSFMGHSTNQACALALRQLESIGGGSVKKNEQCRMGRCV